jgi:hypothetical protein
VRLWIVAVGCGVIATAGAIALSPALAGREGLGQSASPNHICTSAGACLKEVNKGTGVGIDASGTSGGVFASSSAGNGMTGTTTAFNASTGFSGIAGADLATPNPSGTPFFNSGVYGRSSTGTGVQGNSVDGPGVSGTSGGSSGVVGYTQSNVTGISGSGVFGEDISSTSLAQGVTGFSSTGIGIQGDQFESGKYLNAAFLGLTFKSNITTYFPKAPPGGLFNSDIGEGVVAESAGSTAETLAAANFGGGPLMRLYASTLEIMDVDNKGNMILKGKLTQHGNPHTVMHSLGAGDIVMYSPAQAIATVEDVGEAHLTLGEAFVRIDPRFAATMDTSRPYLVFLTPQGDSNGLFVTEKSTTGFAVHEHDGRSNVAFDYRIVAIPYEPQGARLATSPGMPAQGFTRSITTHKPVVLPNGGVKIQN